MLESYPEVLTVDDVRVILKIGRTKAYNLVSSGKIKSIVIGKAIRVPKQFLVDYISQSSEQSAEPR